MIELSNKSYYCGRIDIIKSDGWQILRQHYGYKKIKVAFRKGIRIENRIHWFRYHGKAHGKSFN